MPAYLSYEIEKPDFGFRGQMVLVNDGNILIGREMGEQEPHETGVTET